MAAESDTAGLKCAPDIAPKVRMRATNPAPVASVFASKAMATLPAESRSAMISDPITTASRNAVPSASDKARRESSVDIDSILVR